MEYWKFKAIDKLRDYPLKAAAIQSLQEELQRLELEATNIRSATADATPVQGGGSSREDKLLSNIIHRDEIKRMIAGAKLACNVVNTSLAALDAAERDLLTDMYIRRNAAHSGNAGIRRAQRLPTRRSRTSAVRNCVIWRG